MNFQTFFRRLVVSASLAIVALAGNAFAQTATIIRDPSSRAVARGNNLYCAGYVQTAALDTSNHLIGGWNEQDGWMYAQNNELYLNMGSNKDVHLGDVFAVVRPKGGVKTRWTKKGDLGFYVQEVGSVEVIRVKEDHSVARVRTSCDNFMLGDVLQPMEVRSAPVVTQRPPLDRFADPNGKAVGRLFMIRDGREIASTEGIVYVDLGSEDNVQVGDYMTVFRKVGKGNPFENYRNEEIDARNSDYGSTAYSGNVFSNQAPRKGGKHAGQHTVGTGESKDGRPELRKVVGEGVVLNVKERTATVLVTRNAQEIHTGDWVEVQ